MTTTPPGAAGAIDWTKVLEDEAKADEEFGAIPPGPYLARVETAEATRASTGSPMIKVKFAVQGGPYNDRWVYTNIVLKLESRGSMRFGMRKLRALGIDVAQLAAENTPLEQVAKQLVGAVCEIDVSVRDYQGKDQNDVESIKAADGVSRAAAPASDDPPAPSADPHGAISDGPPIPGADAGDPPDPF